MNIGSQSSASSALSAVQAMIASWQSQSGRQIEQDLGTVKTIAPKFGNGILSIVHASRKGIASVLIDTDLRQGGALSDVDGRDFLNRWVRDGAAAYEATNQMSSQDLSDLLYSGRGVAQPHDAPNATMDDETQSLTQFADYHRQLSNGLAAWQARGYTGNDEFARVFSTDAAKVSGYVAEFQQKADSEARMADGIATAFASHTLTIQKATDVEGLDYSETMIDGSYGSAEIGSVVQHWNADFFSGSTEGEVGQDGKHHLLESASTGGLAMLYLSW